MNSIIESNIVRMLEEGYKYGYIVISACRGSRDLLGKDKKDLTDDELELFYKLNEKRTSDLKSDLKSLKLTYYEVDGGYYEETGEEVTENSFFILNYDYKSQESLSWKSFQSIGMELCGEYNQDSFLWFDPQYQSAHKEKVRPCYLDRNGRMVSNSFKGVIYNDLTQMYFTVYKNQRFTLENKENKFMKKFEEKKIDVETKKLALAEYKGVDVEEIEDGYNDNYFEVDGEEWMVLTEDESYDKFKEYEMSLIDDLGLSLFNENFQEHILETCIDEDWFGYVADEEADYYISEMSDEELLEYAKDHYVKSVKNIDDVEDENFDRDDIESECKDYYREEIEIQGVAEYFENVYGRGWADEMKDTLLEHIDWDKVIDELYNWDTKETLHGIMASYDNKEHEFGKYDGEWIFGYQIR